MEDMELKITEGESLQIHTYIEVQGRNIEKTVYVWRTEDNELHVSLMNEQGTDDIQIEITAQGFKIKDMTKGE